MASAALLRYENPAIEIHKAHAGIARVRLPTPSLDGLKHFPSGLGRNSERSLGCHQTNPHIRVIEKGQQRSPLIAGSPFQFLIDCVHLPIKTVIFCIVVIEDRLIFFDAERCEALDQLRNGEIVEVGAFNGLSTPNLRFAAKCCSGGAPASSAQTSRRGFH